MMKLRESPFYEPLTVAINTLLKAMEEEGIEPIIPEISP